MELAFTCQALAQQVRLQTNLPPDNYCTEPHLYEHSIRIVRQGHSNRWYVLDPDSSPIPTSSPPVTHSSPDHKLREKSARVRTRITEMAQMRFQPPPPREAHRFGDLFGSGGYDSQTQDMINDAVHRIFNFVSSSHILNSSMAF
jgi:hypothetical protein